jgi:phosphate starvation-inducible PhoH-like protein
LRKTYQEDVPVVKKSRNQKPPVQKDHLSVAKPLVALNEAQRQCIFAFEQGLNVFAYGSAGTGKSYLACSLALKRLFAGEVEKIIIVRSAVSVRETGFLPGSLDEKADPYKAPYKQIINELCANGTAWDILIKKGMVQIITTSYVRGITLSNSVVIADETQNYNWEECVSVLTRLGKNTQLFMIGDGKQNDLQYKKNDQSGLPDLLKVVDLMSDVFDKVIFTKRDIVRSDFVRKFIEACEELDL